VPWGRSEIKGLDRDGTEKAEKRLGGVISLTKLVFQLGSKIEKEKRSND